MTSTCTSGVEKVITTNALTPVCIVPNDMRDNDIRGTGTVGIDNVCSTSVAKTIASLGKGQGQGRGQGQDIFPGFRRKSMIRVI